jgi:hypothetical protein
MTTLMSATACGGDDRPRPALLRPPAPVWCPSVILSRLGRNLDDAARHGTWDARAIIGLDLDDARRLAERHDCQIRPVGGKDVGPDIVLTMDLRFDRINVDVTDGVVTALDGGASGDMVG